MSSLAVYNQKGEKIGTATLNPTIFGVPEKQDLINRAVIYQLASDRRPIASAKTKAEVRGGGKKPWRQKGTGRARAGSSRSPLWKGGGVVFGPTPERNFKKEMPKKMRRLALFSVLSNKLKSNKIVLLDKLEFKNIKTKQVEEMLNKLPIKEGTVLTLIPQFDPKVELSIRNLPYMKTLIANSLNIIDLMKYDFVLLTKDSLKVIEKTYLKDNEEKSVKPVKGKR